MCACESQEAAGAVRELKSFNLNYLREIIYLKQFI